ncbi:bromodomain-containing protein [Gossypium australe]|uniref:Bromodomain-containing protein n=1 Tax=Gossypium australe TaxID=47621 RepID=A0A5B6UWY8_9ROSI|nr:bromodomain-containing protein [Gossypium australe]
MAKNDATLRNLENQMRRKSSKENCKVVTLRSGRTLEPNEVEVEDKPTKKEDNQPTIEIPAPEKPDSTNSKKVKSKLGNSDKLTPSLDVDILPRKSCPVQAKVSQPLYPQRLQQHKQQHDTQFKRMLDVLKQLRINIPLVEALEQMLNYAKAIKEFQSKKKKFWEFETVALTIECSLFFLKGSFTIHCNIGESYYGKSLCNLGSSMNLMPTYVFRRLGIGNARLTIVTVQLVDKSLAHPKGKIEEVLVHVDKFIFPADFIILDLEANKEVSIILERPFLATGRTIIDVQKGELTMRVQDERVTFNVLKALRSPNEVKYCFTISKTDLLVHTKLEFNYSNDLLEGISSDSPHQDEDNTCLALLEAILE